jgi:uncharacterized protein (TIGR02265 family)
MDSLEHLRSRRARVKPGDECNGMSFEGIHSTLERELGRDVAEQVRRGPHFPKRVISVFKYPVRMWLEAIEQGAGLLAAKGFTFDQALEAFAAGGVTSFFESPIGRTMVAMNGGNAQRMMTAAALAYKTVYNFGEREYEKLGANEGVMRYRSDYGGPATQIGVLATGLKVTLQLVPTVLVEDASPDGSDFNLRVRW